MATLKPPTTTPATNGVIPGKVAPTTTVHQATIVRHKGPITLPEGMTLEQGVSVLQEEIKSDASVAAFQHDFDCFPWDGAVATHKALLARFGAAFIKGIPSFFSAGIARELAVSSGPNGESIRVPWGRIFIPGAPDKVGPEAANFFQTGTTMSPKGAIKYQLQGVAQRGWLPTVDAVVEDIKRLLAAESLYRGKAIKVQFTEAGNPKERLKMPVVEFIKTGGIQAHQIVFARSLEAAIHANIYTRIEFPEATARLGVPSKGGCILAGPPGVGKSELARLVAQRATSAGATYILCEQAQDLPYALQLAGQYGPNVVVFVEDIDRVASGERTADIDKLLNTVDGVDTKSMSVYIIVTTNNISVIRDEFKRPGRFDLVLTLTPPDAEAVRRMILAHTVGMVEADLDLTRTGELLAGLSPANIVEAVNRAKLGFISRVGATAGTPAMPVRLTAQDFETAAFTVKAQVEEIHASHRPASEHPAFTHHQALVDASATAAYAKAEPLLKAIHAKLS